MKEGLALASAIAAARESAIISAAHESYDVRQVIITEYNLPDCADACNTDDGCFISAPETRYATTLTNSVEVHYPADAPREEVLACLRHIIRMLETDTVPQHRDDVEPDEEAEIEAEGQ